MKREIKFKVYNKLEKTISDAFSLKDIKAYDGEIRSIYFDTPSGMVEIGNDLGYGRNDADEIQCLLVFLQFTGFKDITGKEIYECDILTDGKINYLVKFHEGCWIAERSISECGISNPKLYDLENAKIISNIYENTNN